MQAEKQAMVAALSARKAQLASDLARLTSTQTSDPGIVSEQAQLSRNYEVLKDQYDKLLADRDDVRLRGDVQSETDAIKFRVIDPPSSPRVPAAPNRPLLLLAVLVVGVGGGVGAAFRSEEHTSELQSLMGISYAGCCLKKKRLKQQ